MWNKGAQIWPESRELAKTFCMGGRDLQLSKILGDFKNSPPCAFLLHLVFAPNPKNDRNTIIFANTNIFIGRKSLPLLNLYPLSSPKLPLSKNVLIWMIRENFYFLENLNFSN